MADMDHLNNTGGWMAQVPEDGFNKSKALKTGETNTSSSPSKSSHNKQSFL
jgi:hypothetical protein